MLLPLPCLGRLGVTVLSGLNSSGSLFQKMTASSVEAFGFVDENGAPRVKSNFSNVKMAPKNFCWWQPDQPSVSENRSQYRYPDH